MTYKLNKIAYSMLWVRIKNYFKSFPARISKTKVRAVYDDDLMEMLGKMHMKERLIHGEFHCEECGSPISLDNLQAIMPTEDGLQFICSNKTCISKLLK